MAVNRTKVLEAAQKFLSKGQYDKAIAEYQKLVTEDPRDVRTLLKIGDLHTRRNKPKDAIEVYQKVAELYAKQGFFLKAVAVYKQILKLDPNHIESSQKLAKMYEELALTSDALSTYEQVADAYLNQGQFPKALEILQRMVDLDGQNIAVRIKYAEALSKADRPREAAKAFADGAHLLKEQGRMDDYIRVVERQLYHDPENVNIARELSSLYLERSDPKRALAKLQICFKADPRDIQTLEMLAEAFRQLGQIPKTVSVLKEIARLHQEVGAVEPRRRTLKRILDLDPNDAEARQAMAALANAPAPAPNRPVASSPQAARPAPPAPAQRAAPESEYPPVPEPEEDIELEVEDAESLEPDDDAEVFVVDDGDPEPAPTRAEPAYGRPAPSEPRVPTQAGAQRPAAPSLSNAERIAQLLDEAERQESAGRYDSAETLLKQALAIDAEHVQAHERLKDLYLATDRRVDAVRELLWLSEAWETENRERATQYAKAAYDLAPHSAATRTRLRNIGIDPDNSQQEQVMFVDDSRSQSLDDTGEASLDAILPPMSEPPPPRSAADSARLRAPTVPGDRRAAQEDPLDIPLSPDEFDAEPPAPRPTTVTKSMVAELLERPITPEEFELEPEPLPAYSAGTDEAYDAPAGVPYDDMQALLDAPISPDEFDAPPPRRELAPRPADVEELLEQPLPPDDFGLSDERFDRSGLIDVEEPHAKQTVAPPPPVSADMLTRAEMIDAQDEPSIEFAEINTGEVDLDSGTQAALEDSGSTVIEDAPLLGSTTARPTGEDFADLGTGDVLSIPSDLPPRPAPPPPRPQASGLPPIPPPSPKVELKQPPLPAPPIPAPSVPALTAKPPKDETDFSDLDLDAGPDPTLRGEPIPELVRQSIPTRDIEAQPDAQVAETPRAAPEVTRSKAPTPVPATAAPEVTRSAAPTPVPSASLPEVTRSAAPTPVPAAATPVPREEPTATLNLPVTAFEDTEEVVFHPDDDLMVAQALTTSEPAEEQEAEAAAPAEEAKSAPESAGAAEEEVIPPELEEILDEAEFFSSQGMHDEALEAVQEAILIYPKFKILKQKLAEYEAKADAKEAEQEQKAQEAHEDDSFDIAQQLATELAEESGAGSVDEMVDVESVFAQFKKGVAQQISVDDSDTHFDLGIAYKEMGLIDDAMQEFETAARNPQRACTALTMIGMCCLEKGEAPRAVEYFERALASKQKSAGEELALFYELGNAYELLGDVDRAVQSFEKVVARDRAFRGAASRLEQLKKQSTKSAGAVG